MSNIATITKSFNIDIRNVKCWECVYGVAAQYDVFINGIKAFHVHDNANGGMYQYQIYVPELFNKFKSAVDSLPEMVVFKGLMKIDIDMALALIHDILESPKALKQ